MILRAKTFRSWMQHNFDKSQLEDIRDHGADAGWPGLTYTSDCVQLFDKYGEEIWDMLYEAKESYGNKSVAELIAGFNRAEMSDDLRSFKTLMVWFAAEEYARQMTEEEE